MNEPSQRFVATLLCEQMAVTVILYDQTDCFLELSDFVEFLVSIFFQLLLRQTFGFVSPRDKDKQRVSFDILAITFLLDRALFIEKNLICGSLSLQLKNAWSKHLYRQAYGV